MLEKPTMNTSQIIILIQLLEQNYSKKLHFPQLLKQWPWQSMLLCWTFYITKPINQVAVQTDVLYIVDPGQCFNYLVLNGN